MTERPEKPQDTETEEWTPSFLVPKGDAEIKCIAALVAVFQHYNPPPSSRARILQYFYDRFKYERGNTVLDI